jgi:hypothetical protein
LHTAGDGARPGKVGASPAPVPPCGKGVDSKRRDCSGRLQKRHGNGTSCLSIRQPGGAGPPAESSAVVGLARVPPTIEF